MDTNDLAKIFWTGGWDSTFRVLYLVIVEKRKVQPYYIRGVHTKTKKKEILAMDLIKEKMFKIYPETKHLLKPTIFIPAENIAADKEIKQNFLKLEEEYSFTPQNYYMARFAKETGLDNIEICTEKNRENANSWIGALYDMIPDNSMRIDKKYSNTDLYKVCGYGSFPLLHLTKYDMKEIATKFNFIELLNESWFCNYPINGKPCGTCSACMRIMEMKMYDRMPLISRVRYYTSPKRYLKSLLKKHPRLKHKVKKLFGKTNVHDGRH